MCQDIILVSDYHDTHCVIRTVDRATGAQSVRKVATAEHTLNPIIDEAARVAHERGGRLIWLQESTTGWARMKALVGERAEFLLANVLQMPLPPKAQRRKTDKVDTARMAREYLNGELPLAFQPEGACRQLRRVVMLRENLVARRTSLRNWINRYLAHETWYDRTGLWSQKGVKRLKKLTFPTSDKFVIDLKLGELELLTRQLEQVELQMLEVYQSWPEAQGVDAIKGIGPISAVSILARIGPIERFPSAEQLIGFGRVAQSLDGQFWVPLASWPVGSWVHGGVAVGG